MGAAMSLDDLPELPEYDDPYDPDEMTAAEQQLAAEIQGEDLHHERQLAAAEYYAHMVETDPAPF
jgi:hypothetical protein